jgi:hypothetical protein
MEINTNLTDIPDTIRKTNDKDIDMNYSLLEPPVLSTTNPFDAPTEVYEVEENGGNNLQEKMGKIDIADVNDINLGDNRNSIADDGSDITHSLICQKETVAHCAEERSKKHVPDFGNRSVLANHHPMSPYYFEFIWKKLLFLLLDFYCVFVFWIVQFPQLFVLTSGESTINEWLVLTLSNTFGMAVTCITLTWMILIVKVNINQFYNINYDVDYNYCIKL